MRQILLLIGYCFVGYALQAQEITEAEYFFNQDPGIGEGIELMVDANSGLLSQAFAIDPSGLDFGFNAMYIRTKNVENNWSHYDRSLFYLRSTNFGGDIVAAEYYFDNTGTGVAVNQGIPLNIDSPDTSIMQSYTLETTDLSVGFHSLHIRTRDVDNNWSHYDRSVFYVENFFSEEDITAAEYYFDNNGDNGLGVTQGSPLPIEVQAPNTIQSYMIPVTDLAEGFHMFYIRTKTELDIWSLYDKSVIYIKDFGNNEISSAEYFIDEDPGVGLGINADITGGILGIEFDTDGLELGAHLFCIRVLDKDGDWSLYDCEIFVIDESLSKGESFYNSTTLFPNPFSDNIIISTNRVIEKASVINLSGQKVYSTNSIINNKIDLGQLASGIYILKISTKNESATFKVIKN